MQRLIGGLAWLGFFIGVNVLAAGLFFAFGKALQWAWPAGVENPLVVLVVGLAALAASLGGMLYAVRAIGRPRRSLGRARG